MFETVNLREDLREKLDNGYQVRPFPEAVSRLLAATKDPDSNTATMSQIIETDAGLASRLLCLANSPVFGFSREIRSINQAVVVLGVRAIKDLAVTFAGSTLISGGNELRELRKNLWQHSLACAITAKEIATFDPELDPNQAFLAGIFHDVGKTIFLDLVPDEYGALMSSKYGSGLTAYEVQLFGMTHEWTGEKMMDSWGLPEEISVPCAFHHRHLSANSHQRLAETIGNADLISLAFGIGSLVDPQQVLGADVVFAAYGLNEEAIVDLRSKIESEFQQMCSLF